MPLPTTTEFTPGTFPSSGVYHSAALVACTAPVAVLLGATRWGSYIGYQVLYLTDLLIAFGVAHYWLSITRKGKVFVRGYTSRSVPGLSLQIFYIYVCGRLLTSVDGIGSLPWIRDAVPFLYIGIAFVSASAVSRSYKPMRQRTMRVIWWALFFHLGWTSAVILAKVNTEQFPRFPGAAVSVGSLRPDVDCAVLGVTAALLLRKALRRDRTLLSLGLFGLCLATVAGTTTRGGFVAVAVTVSLGLALVYFASNVRSAKRQVVVALTVAAVLSLGIYVPNSTLGQRLLATVDPALATDAALGAVGTAHARDATWQLVVDWTEQTKTRRLVGAGPGPDFVTESGASKLLEGTQYQDVRSPHNWLIGLYARMGLVGVVLALMVIASLGYTIWRHRRRIGDDEFLFACTMIVAAVIPVALVGVVLESPFGAVPFWWASGILLALGPKDVCTRRSQADSTRGGFCS